MKILFFDGHLAKDAEIKTSPKGAQYLSFRVGNTTYVKGENKTDWIDVASFNVNDINGKGPYLKKGSHVFVIGTPDTILNNGNGRLYLNTSVFADRIEFIGGSGKKKEGEGEASDEPSIKVESTAEPEIPAAAPAPAESPAPAATPSGSGDDDELPF